jgi:hypothetical protein
MVKRIIFLLCCCGLFFSSCTVEKKRYSFGYHFDYPSKNNVLYKGIDPGKINQIVVSNEIKKNDTYLKNIISAKVNEDKKLSPISPGYRVYKLNTPRVNIKKNLGKITIQKNKLISDNIPSSEKKIHPNAVTALVLGLIGLLCATISIFLLAEYIYEYFLLFCMLTVCFSVVAIIVGANAKKAIATEKEYEGGEFAAVGIVFGVASIFLLALLTLLDIIFFIF